MKKTVISALLLLTALFVTGFCLSSCGEKGATRLPELETQEIPEDDELLSTIVSGGFTFGVHETYAEIVSYVGSEREPVIPDHAAGIPVKVIGESAFKDNPSLTKITMPSGLLLIGRYAFDGCVSLTGVVFNEGLETIGDYAFRNSGLTSLDLPDSVIVIGKYAFYRTQVTAFNVPESVSRIGKFAFYGCAELNSITFSPRLYEIGECVFYNCTSLTELVIPKTIEEIGNYAFSGCTSLTKIVLPAETAKIGEGVFAGCEALTVYAPAGSAAEKNAKRNQYRFEAVDYEKAASGGGVS